MKSVANRFLFFTIVLLFVVLHLAAQQRPADPADPRIGLKAGFKDASVAARNMGENQTVLYT